MKKISLPEFKDYCKEFSFNTFIFATENQSWDKIDSTIRMDMEFDSMIIAFNPNIIYLKGERKSIQFNRVVSIKIHEEPCVLGVVFTIVCENSSTDTESQEYTLIAR